MIKRRPKARGMPVAEDPRAASTKAGSGNGDRVASKKIQPGNGDRAASKKAGSGNLTEGGNNHRASRSVSPAIASSPAPSVALGRGQGADAGGVGLDSGRGHGRGQGADAGGAGLGSGLGSVRGHGLGRGLSTLFGDDGPGADLAGNMDKVLGKDEKPTAAAPGLGTPVGDRAPDDGLAVRMVALADMCPGRHQPRRSFDDDGLRELADSMRRHGVLQPIIVRPLRPMANRLADSTGESTDESTGQSMGAPTPKAPVKAQPGNEKSGKGNAAFEIVAGERRWRAAALAGIDNVPVMIADYDDNASFETALVENLQRQNLNPIEEAQGYERMAELFKRTQMEIARAVGKSRPYVANRMRLLKLPGEVRDMLAGGDVNASHARVLLQANDPLAVARDIARHKLNVRNTASLTKKALKIRKGAEIRRLEEEISQAIGLDISIRYSPSTGGSVTVRYRTLEQFEDIIRRLRGTSSPRT